MLAVINQADWIACTVALASQCMAIIDYFYLPAQLAANNKAVEDVHNLISKWDSLSLVQRKMRENKLKCVNCCEGAILDLCAARTQESKALPGEDAGDDDEDE